MRILSILASCAILAPGGRRESLRTGVAAATEQLRGVLRVLCETQGHLRAGHLLRRESLPPPPLPQVAVHRQAAHVVRARVAEFEAGRQGHEGDHRPREGGATPTPRRADGLTGP